MANVRSRGLVVRSLTLWIVGRFPPVYVPSYVRVLTLFKMGFKIDFDAWEKRYRLRECLALGL